MFIFLVATMVVVGTHFFIRAGHRNEQVLATERWDKWATDLVSKFGYDAPELKLAIANMPPELSRKYLVEMAPN